MPQPRGVLYHNLAGNTFNVGLISMFVELVWKNVDIIRLPHEEPYFTVDSPNPLPISIKKLEENWLCFIGKGLVATFLMSYLFRVTLIVFSVGVA